ncbi:DUF3152 domain-containing protein [Streptomyces sp. 135]|uniref:DUF3152 domain-containing protein n=1 Tax=Streptomyces sp. 135 TaxID=2838850 RepID=UPI001CBC233E|nr:DUF3152 domain-containing protein [Streptomyces sp. 135]
MGRHSRRGPAATPDNKSTTGTAQPQGADAGARPQSGAQPGPGTGRRRRAPGGDGAPPAHGTPVHEAPPQSPLSPAAPEVRGGHPEQREPGGGWGDASGGGAEPGAGAGQSGLPRPSRARRGRQGPRQDYVEAFPEGAPEGAGPGAPPPPHDPYASVTEWTESPAHRADGGADDFSADAGASDGASDGGGSDSDGGGGVGSAGARKGGRVRIFTGIAAAAVTAVLAIVVAGQVADGADDSDVRPQAAPGGGARDTEDPASRSDERPPPKEPVKGPEAAPVTYEQKMGKKYPLDADLKGSGDFEVVPGFDKAPGKGQLYRYRVDVEKGLGLDGTLFAQAVHKTLNDDRSWAHDGGRAFQRISSGKPHFVITLASPGTTAEWCAKSGLDTTQDNVSCDSAATERVMINAFRWAQGAKTYGDAVKKKYGSAIFPYRQMLINHEVGHRLGFNHTDCTEDGGLAPVMQQQTKFLNHDGIKCKANPWAYPEG